MDWLKKLKEYAPDIAAAVASGGASLPELAVKAVSDALGLDVADKTDLAATVSAATPDDMLKLKQANNQFLIEKMKLQLNDLQVEHETTQETIRNGDNSDDVVVRRTRPLQSWLSLVAAIAYVFLNPKPDSNILMLLLTLPWVYAGLRQVGKGVTALSLRNIKKG